MYILVLCIIQENMRKQNENLSGIWIFDKIFDLLIFFLNFIKIKNSCFFTEILCKIILKYANVIFHLCLVFIFILVTFSVFQ